MDDLQLAVESVLFGHSPPSAEVTLEAQVGEQIVALDIGPLDDAALQADLPDRHGGIGLERLLHTLVERAELVDRSGERWLRLEKRIPSRAA